MYQTPSHLAQKNAECQSLVPYFGLGFRKTTLDPSSFEKISNHFAQNKDKFYQEKHIEYLQTQKPNYSPSLLVEDPVFNQNLCRDLKGLHEEWSGMELREAACYGIRVYQPGSFLYNHVDRTKTHLISSTICVAYSLHKPWPLYIEDIDGNPYEILMEPGEMVFYEGAKLLHGRPNPLDGRFYAGLFVHYTPVN